MKGDAIGQRWPVFSRQLLVGLFDCAVEDACADAVALTRLLSDATGKDEVIRLAPFRGDLVLAEELHKLRLKDDLADSGGCLGGADI
ncbi:MAG TPA: hypothetical protein VII45_13270 [Solirubrobacterales bacterium]